MTNREFCNKYGYTMSELSKLSGVSRPTLYDMDAKRYNVNPKTVQQVLATRKELTRINETFRILTVILWVILVILLVLL